MEEARAWLALLGLEADEGLLDACARRVRERILNACNVASVPEGLRHCAAGLILAEVLTALRAAGALDGSALSVEPLVKQLSEGDTTIAWAADQALSKDQLLDRLLEALRAQESQFVKYRRLVW